METHHFWAFFIIALIAGASIAFAISNAAMTGYATTTTSTPTLWQRIFGTTPPQTISAPAPTTAVTGCENCVCVVKQDKVIADCVKNCVSTIQDESKLLKCITDCLLSDTNTVPAMVKGPGGVSPSTNIAAGGKEVLCCYAGLPECCPWSNML